MSAGTRSGAPCDEFDEVSPDASAMIETMRAYGYSLPAAIADLIDNSIAAGAKVVRVWFHWNGSDSWVSVLDDGSGMSDVELRDAMRLGSKNPLEERQPKDLGRFGLGLKTASLSQCRRLTVASRTARRREAVRRWDLDHLARPDVKGWQLLRSPHPGSEDRMRMPDDQRRGTIVLWEDLDRIVGDTSVDDEKTHERFLEQVEEVEETLSMVFERFLRRRRGRLRIEINGNALPPWDPFLTDHKATQVSPVEEIRLPGHAEPIRVTGYVLPHKDKLGEEGHRAASGPLGWNAQQGFYVYRNDRLIVAGSWLGLPWTKEEHYKLARIQISIPNSMDHLWQLDVKKSTARPPNLVRDRLKGLALTVRQTARQVFSHRGRYGRRRKKEEIRRPWEVRRRSGAVFYRIDRQHPLVQAVLADAKGESRKRIEGLLRIVEETVPVDRIWLNTAERPEEPAAPLQHASPKEKRLLIELTYRTLRSELGISHGEALELLKSAEEFADEDSHAIITTLKDSE